MGPFRWKTSSVGTFRSFSWGHSESLERLFPSFAQSIWVTCSVLGAAVEKKARVAECWTFENIKPHCLKLYTLNCPVSPAQQPSPRVFCWCGGGDLACYCFFQETLVCAICFPSHLRSLDNWSALLVPEPSEDSAVQCGLILYCPCWAPCPTLPRYEQLYGVYVRCTGWSGLQCLVSFSLLL